MFVRKKPNRSGLISVQIIDRSSGKYVVRETAGSSGNSQEIEFLVKKGKLTPRRRFLFQELDVPNKELLISLEPRTLPPVLPVK